MFRLLSLLVIVLSFYANSFAQSYTHASGSVCGAYNYVSYTFPGTPETPVDATLDVSWIYCGPYLGSNFGNLDMDIWIDDNWVEIVDTSDSGSGCSWANSDSFTIGATQLNDAINTNGGSVTIRGRITDGCAAGVGCSCCNDPCYNATLTYDYAPSADFYSNTQSTCIGGAVEFTQSSTGPQETWFWDFGEGADPETASGEGPHLVSWSTTGFKTITMTVYGNSEEDTETKVDYVEVLDSPETIGFGAYEVWQRTENLSSIIAKHVIDDKLGGYYVIGEYFLGTSNIWVKRIDQDGNEIWHTNIGSFTDDHVHDVVVDDNGMLYLCGTLDNEAMLKKVQFNGNNIWTESWDSGGSVAEAHAVTYDDDGNVYATGFTDLGSNSSITRKYDTNGNFDFEMVVSGDGDMSGEDVLFVDGHVYVLSSGLFDNLNEDMVLSKFETVLGVNQWHAPMNGSGFGTDVAISMVYDGTQNFFCMGESDQGLLVGYSIWCINTDGNEGWSDDYFGGMTGWDVASRYGQDSNGNLFLASTVSTDPNTTIEVKKINPTNGNEVWTGSVTGINATELWALSISPNDNIHLAAHTFNNAGDWDLMAAEVDNSSGDTNWWAVYDGCGSDHDSAADITSCPNNDALVFGYNTQTVLARLGQEVAPDASFELASAACEGAVVTFSDTSEGSGLSYEWDFGADADPPTAIGQGPHDVVYSSLGTKTVTLDIENGLGTDSFELEIEISSLPVLFVSDDVEICAGEAATISATSDGTISWDNGLGEGEEFLVSPGSTTTYNATATSTEGCEFTDDVKVTVNPLPAVDAGSDITDCDGYEVFLVGTGDGNLEWSDGLGYDPLTLIIIDGNQTFMLTATTAAGCTDTDEVEVTALPSPDVDAGTDLEICDGDVVTLHAEGADTYVWIEIGEGQNQTISPSETMEYTVEGTNANGCQAYDSVVVTVFDTSEASAGDAQEICEGETAILEASGGVSYSWEGIGPGAVQEVQPTETTLYTVTVTNAQGCMVEANTVVNVNAVPEADAGDDQVICLGESATLAGDGGVAYNWIGVEEGQVVEVTPSSTTTYVLEVTAVNGCTDEDEVTVEVSPVPNVNAGDDVEICAGESFVLNAVGGETYEWDNGLGEGQSHEVTPLLTTTYEVEAMNTAGCTATDEITITVLDAPAANAGADQSICPGETATLNGSGGVEFDWQPGDLSGSSVDVTPSETTTYTLIVFDDQGCSGTDEVIVEVFNVTEPTIEGLQVDPYCVESDIAVSMTGDPAEGTFSGAGVNGDEFVPANAGVGTHEITYEYTDGNGCDASTTVEVSVEVCDFVEEWQSWVEAYPVPTSDELNVIWSGEGTLSADVIMLFDASGRKVQVPIQISGQGLVLSLGNLASGNYTLTITIGEKSWTKTVVVSK